MPRAVVLQHAQVEGPGRIADVLNESGYELSLHTLRGAEDLPQVLPEELLVVMGGSMGVGDLDWSEFPYLRKEVELLQRRIAQGAPVLGVCLGAQLLAYAAGAAVEPMKRRDGARAYEVGWAPIRFHPIQTPNGTADELLEGIPEQAMVLHWHGDAFELPLGARLFASSPLCNQGFQLGSSYGLQFHCEVTESQIEDFLREDRDYVLGANGADGVEQLRRDTKEYFGSFCDMGNRLLGNIVRALTTR